MKTCLSLFLLILCCYSCNRTQKIDRTSLQATKDDPIFATYAAAKERSSFMLDQGYEFHFYNDEEGLSFCSEQGGDIGISFLDKDQWIYYLPDLYKESVIHASFPDMVTFSYYPMEKIRCDAAFLVERSSAAILEVKITNESDDTKSITYLPFLRNNYRTFENIRSEQNGLIFTNEKYPDSWTVNHKMPHVDTVFNYVALNTKPDETGIFNCFDAFGAQLSFSIEPDKEQFFQVIGRAYTPKGERYLDNTPQVRFQIWKNNQMNKIITEKSPLWGIYEQTVDRGYFRIELGNLGIDEKPLHYSMLYFLEDENLIASYDTFVTVNFEQPYLRRDLIPKENNLPLPPVNVIARDSGNVVKITWQSQEQGMVHDIYRSSETEGAFHRIVTNISKNHFIDKTALPDITYRYVVIALNPQTGKRSIHSREAVNIPKASFKAYIQGDIQPDIYSDARYLSFKCSLILEANESQIVRLVRVSDRPNTPPYELKATTDTLFSINLNTYLRENQKLFTKFTQMATFDERDKNLLYMSANNLMRQVFYPPEGESSYNYYVFSREPVWGWGHGGQVFHESITMLAYADMDPIGAMNSQRVYSERQYYNGYINYRTGSYLNEIIEHNDELTSSAPWYSWLNWEIYKMTSDREFLEEMYSSSKRFYNFFIETRDKDEDGLLEWGGHAVLESVRDALVAVWDEVGWPSNFDGVDINSMMVMEAKSLEAMAKELGKTEEAEMWQADHEKRAELINRHMWDEETGFYYNVDKKTNTFTFKEKNDLKRQEIIGFLPLWAGIASEEQATQLVKALTDPERFWRPKGIPSLSAADSFYNPKGYWNGPVWVQWNYLIMRGLLDYGYEKEARELVDRVAGVMIEQLKENHNLWEFYSPDHNWGGYHKTYIWAGIINRMMLDVQHIQTGR